MTLGLWNLFLLVRKLLDANGFIELSIILMAPLRDSKQD